PFGHGPRRVGGLIHFGGARGEALAAHFGAQLIADLGAVEADDRRVTLGEPDRVGRRGECVPMRVLNTFEVAPRNSSLRGDILEADARFLARGAQPLADRWDVRFDQLFVHRLAFPFRAAPACVVRGLRRACQPLEDQSVTMLRLRAQSASVLRMSLGGRASSWSMRPRIAAASSERIIAFTGPTPAG